MGTPLGLGTHNPGRTGGLEREPGPPCSLIHSPVDGSRGPKDSVESPAPSASSSVPCSLQDASCLSVLVLSVPSRTGALELQKLRTHSRLLWEVTNVSLIELRDGTPSKSYSRSNCSI